MAGLHGGLRYVPKGLRNSETGTIDTGLRCHRGPNPDHGGARARPSGRDGLCLGPGDQRDSGSVSPIQKRASPRRAMNLSLQILLCIAVIILVAKLTGADNARIGLRQAGRVPPCRHRGLDRRIDSSSRLLASLPL